MEFKSKAGIAQFFAMLEREEWVKPIWHMEPCTMVKDGKEIPGTHAVKAFTINFDKVNIWQK